MRRISIFGVTGSIGQSTVDLIARDADAYDVVALTGGANIDLLATTAKRLNAQIAVTAYPDKLPALKDALSGTGIESAAGDAAIAEAATRPVDWAMSAIVGIAGLIPGLKIIEQGATLALANKESLVTAGPLLMAMAKTRGATVLPVDSEHSAVFQALIGEDITAVERVIITASGGAFRDWPIEKLASATCEQASSHPNWDMGQRITIDSASMFNKALEVIETREFFDVAPEQIEVLIHPQSMIHAMVGFHDGGIMAHVGPPDMRHAIGFALHWPKRKTLPVERLDFAKLGRFDFANPDLNRYPALRIADEVMAQRGLSGAAFNGAKEQVLDAFIANDIGFLDMAQIVEATCDAMWAQNGLSTAAVTLDNIRETDQVARDMARALIAKGT